MENHDDISFNMLQFSAHRVATKPYRRTLESSWCLRLLFENDAGPTIKWWEPSSRCALFPCKAWAASAGAMILVHSVGDDVSMGAQYLVAEENGCRGSDRGRLLLMPLGRHVPPPSLVWGVHAAEGVAWDSLRREGLLHWHGVAVDR